MFLKLKLQLANFVLKFATLYLIEIVCKTTSAMHSLRTSRDILQYLSEKLKNYLNYSSCFETSSISIVKSLTINDWLLSPGQTLSTFHYTTLDMHVE